MPENQIILSEEQNAVCEWYRTGKGNLVVRARAGTGKTFTTILAIGGAPEKRILYVQFNKKNQLEVSGKISDPRVEVKTLHAVGYAFIRRAWGNVRADDFVESDRVKAVIGWNEKSEIYSNILRLVGFAKNMTINPSKDDLIDIANERDCIPDDTKWGADRMAEVVLRVLEISKSRDSKGRISFNDMVWVPVACGMVTADYDLVVVDECQDMNLPQLEMSRRASKGRVCVIGDDRQAIYGFRGAASNGLDLMKDTLQASELGLTVTRRCPHKVVTMAQALVPDYQAAPEAPEGTVDELNTIKLVEVATPGQAILSRLNAPLMPLCLSFIRANKPAKIEGRDIGKALAGIVKKLNASSVDDFLAKLDTWHAKQTARVIKGRNGDRRAAELDDQAETLRAVAEGCDTVADIINRLETLFVDSNGERAQTILLSSTHKAKGLEWDRVYLLRDTYNKRMGTSPEAAREESNIYYVAMTRAKNHLTMVS